MYFPHLRHRHDFSSHSPASQNFLTPGPHNGTPRVPRAAMEFPFQSAQMHNKVFSPAKKGICRRRGRFLLKIHNIHFIRRKQTFHRDPCANSRRPGKATRADSHTPANQPHAPTAARQPISPAPRQSRTPAKQPHIADRATRADAIISQCRPSEYPAPEPGSRSGRTGTCTADKTCSSKAFPVRC